MNLDICTTIGNVLIDKKIRQEGLMYGKAGISIFFYHLAKDMPDKKYKRYADKLIDDVFKKGSSHVNFQEGVAGIGWCFEYLIQKGFCKGNPDEVLESIDIKLFKMLTEQNEIPFDLKNGLIGYLQYLIMRLKKKKNHKSNEFQINIELLKLVVNKIDQAAPPKFICLTRDTGFNLLENIYILLWSLSEACKLDIYNVKILNMFKQWESYLISYLPSIHFNRLYLAVILAEINKWLLSEKINKQINILLYSIEAESLRSEVDMEKIDNICYGYLGQLFVLNESIHLFDSSYPNYTLLTSIRHEIIHLCNDLFIEKFRQKETDSKEYTESKYGIVEGWAGVGLMLLLTPDINKS